MKQLPERKRGQPPLLGDKLDNFLQELIIALRSKGAPINTNVVISIGRGIMLKNREADLPDFGGTIVLHKEWAQSVLKRMGFTKRRACSKTKVIPKDFVEIQRQ